MMGKLQKTIVIPEFYQTHYPSFAVATITGLALIWAIVERTGTTGPYAQGVLHALTIWISATKLYVHKLATFAVSDLRSYNTNHSIYDTMCWNRKAE